jgi:hypothetical protein
MLTRPQGIFGIGVAGLYPSAIVLEGPPPVQIMERVADEAQVNGTNITPVQLQWHVDKLPRGESY